jgi:3-dehydroquinate dehydratase-1
MRNELKTRAGTVVIGEVPRVVGTASTFPDDVASWVRDISCDIVEVRLDQMPQEKNWLSHCRLIQNAGIPVILTIRHQSEGGKWNGAEEQRAELFQQGLREVSAVDVELKSEIAVQVAEEAKRLGKVCIVSFHDFARTPPLAELQSIVSRAQEFAGIVKVTTMANAEKDIEVLRQLLKGIWKVPLCLMGMGELGAKSRVALAAAGSCWVYGYLDKPMAPGQMAAEELVRQLAEIRRPKSEGRKKPLTQPSPHPMGKGRR